MFTYSKLGAFIVSHGNSTQTIGVSKTSDNINLDSSDNFLGLKENTADTFIVTNEGMLMPETSLELDCPELSENELLLLSSEEIFERCDDQLSTLIESESNIEIIPNISLESAEAEQNGAEKNGGGVFSLSLLFLLAFTSSISKTRRKIK